ncbi:MAG: type II toxin-antitoxin system Phd/YefM family antitoxin [Propionibacteriaceae bacterium]|nr:type II toxin-antitoxin system Phd/YefM family antitoxin [Propionibacteriaceae bacterium]
MTTVTTRELKQNPQAAIRRVLDAGDPLPITAHGRPTGVCLTPERPAKQRWVSGAALRRTAHPARAEEAADLRAVVEALRRGSPDLADPWDRDGGAAATPPTQP